MKYGGDDKWTISGLLKNQVFGTINIAETSPLIVLERENESTSLWSLKTSRQHFLLLTVMSRYSNSKNLVRTLDRTR